jgi:hypothetical protein
MRDARYETTSQRSASYEQLIPAGAVVETLANGWTRVTAPDPPHWRNGPARPGRPEQRQRRAAAPAGGDRARAWAELDLRRRQLELAKLIAGC